MPLNSLQATPNQMDPERIEFTRLDDLAIRVEFRTPAVLNFYVPRASLNPAQFDEYYSHELFPWLKWREKERIQSRQTDGSFPVGITRQGGIVTLAYLKDQPAADWDNGLVPRFHDVFAPVRAKLFIGNWNLRLFTATIELPALCGATLYQLDENKLGTFDGLFEDLIAAPSVTNPNIARIIAAARVRDVLSIVSAIEDFKALDTEIRDGLRPGQYLTSVDEKSFEYPRAELSAA